MLLMRKRVLAFFAALAVTLPIVTPAQASVLFVSTLNPVTATSSIYAINQSTGAATLVGGVGGVQIADLTNIGNTLYGLQIGDPSQSSFNQLWTIDATTGAASTWVNIGGPTSPITSIAYDPVSNTLYGTTLSGTQLYSINPLTGLATLVGSVGFDLHGLGFGQTGILYGVNNYGELYSINTATGAGTLIGDSDQFMGDIASRPEDNALFAGPGNNYSLLQLNGATGAATTVGQFGSSLNVTGLAFLSSSVPEPSTWTMMLLGFGGIGLSTRRLRRSSRKPRAA